MNATGERAEAAACAWLQDRGLRLLERNYRCRGGELDLVLWDGDELVVAEVRYRRSVRFGHPEETVDPRKQRRIAIATRHLLARRRHLAYDGLRFDVVALSGALDAPQVRWLRDAFVPD